MIDELITNIKNSTDAGSEHNTDPQEHEKKYHAQPDQEERRRKEKKYYKLSDIVDIDTVSFVSSDLLNWFNRKILISGYNKAFGKLNDFDSDNYKQTKDELNDNKKIIGELIKDIEVDSLTLIKILFIMSIGKNFETPYKLYAEDLKKQKNENISSRPAPRMDHSANNNNNTTGQQSQTNEEDRKTNQEQLEAQIPDNRSKDKNRGKSIKNFFKNNGKSTEQPNSGTDNV